jgi:hypothetical protein
MRGTASPISRTVPRNHYPGQCIYTTSPTVEYHVYTCDGEYLTDYTYATGCHRYARKAVTNTRVGMCIPDVIGGSGIKDHHL